MTGHLAQDLTEAEAKVALLKRRIAVAKCQEIGAHAWKSSGGCNAGCCKDCTCSVPVNHCSRCGDCDYGDNQEARETRRLCALRLGEPS